MKLFNITSLKFFGGFLAIIAGSFAIVFVVLYFSPKESQDQVIADVQEQDITQN